MNPPIICVVVLLLCGSFGAAATAHAQEVGIRAGWSSATISFDPEDPARDLTEMRRQSGFVGGVSLLLGGSDRGGWQIEAVVQQKGARNLLRRDDSTRFTYLEVPLLLHADVFKISGSRAVYGIAGVAPAFNLQASYEDDGETEDIRDDIETFDVGLVLGGGYEHGPWVLDARYTWGLRTAFVVESSGTFRHRAFALTGGYRFGR